MYALPLDERLRKAAYQRARYWSDAEYRLRCVNRYRAGKGLPPLASIAEIAVRRDDKGRFSSTEGRARLISASGGD